jgi:hypothetical protein
MKTDSSVPPPGKGAGKPAQIGDIRNLTEAQFAQLGVPELAYVRPIMVDGAMAFGIFAADGSAMAMAPEYDLAVAAIVEHEMFPAAVH